MSLAAQTESVSLAWPDWVRIALSPWQLAFLDDQSLHKIVSAGRGSGKSFIVLLDALIAAMELYYHRSQQPWPRPGPLVIVGIVAPNLQNLRDLWSAAKVLVPRIPGCNRDGEERHLVRENAKTIHLFGQSAGIEIRLMSAWLPNSMRSASIDILVCDEWAFCGYSTKFRKTIEGAGKGGDEIYWSVLEKLVVRAFCYGKVSIASTPLSNYFDDWCQQALAGKGDFGRFSFHQAHALDNMFLTEAQRADIKAERERDEWRYRQERAAELHVVYPKHTAKDAAFTKDLLDSLLVDALPGGRPKPPFTAGIDISWTGPDHLCVLVADATNTLVWAEYWPKTRLDDILTIMRRVHSTWTLRPKRLGYDATGEGKSVNKLLPAEWEAEPVYFWDRQKPHLVSNVMLRMQHAQLHIPNPESFDWSCLPWVVPEGQNMAANFGQLLAELRDYRRQEDTLPGGEKRVRYMRGPHIDRDDGVDALSVLGHVMPAALLPERMPGRSRSSLAEAFRRGTVSGPAAGHRR